MPSPPLDARVIELPEGGAKVVAVADTHGAPHPRALEWIARERPAAILHGGDIGDLGVLSAFEGVAPLIAVRGNIDSPACGVPESRVVSLVRAGGDALVLLLTHIAVYGPRLNPHVKRLAEAHHAQLVVCGHSHVPFITRAGGVWVFNPGSIGPKRANLPIVFGVIDLTGEKVSMVHVDCETGERWFPPRPSARA